MRRPPRATLAAALVAGTAIWLPTTGAAEAIRSGAYTFSDELGGLRLKSVTGSGSAGDPIVIVEEFLGTGPAVLTIIRHTDGPVLLPPAPHLYLEKRVINQSRRVWLGFEMELEEIRGQASTDSDGLSFDQIAKQRERVHADRFRHGERTFDPGDRLMFYDGIVDHSQTVRFRLLVTDTSPSGPFFLVQTPQMATSSLPAERRFADNVHDRRDIPTDTSTR